MLIRPLSPPTAPFRFNRALSPRARQPHSEGGRITLIMRLLTRVLALLALAVPASAQEGALEWDEQGRAYLRTEAGGQIVLPPDQLGSLFGPGRSPFAGQTVQVGVVDNGALGPTSGLFYQLRPAWEALSGATLEIVELEQGALLPEGALALEPPLDGLVLPARALGDYLAREALEPLTPRLESGAFPHWSPEWFAPPSLGAWAGALYTVPLDADAYLLYWRDDILTDATWRARFEEEVGSPLPFPPRTWDEVLAVADYFNGRNWDEADADPDHGLVMPLGDDFDLVNQFLAVSGPYVVRSGEEAAPCNGYWFNPTTLAPLVNSEGHVRGLERFALLAQEGPTAQPTFDLNAAQEVFLRGKAVFTIASADLGPLAQDPTRSLVGGRWGAQRLPGATEVYDLCQGRWLDPGEVNRIGNALGPGWGGAVLAESPHADALYSLFALLATKPVHAWSSALAWSGVAPNLGLERPELAADWENELLESYLNALRSSLTDASQAPGLRIAGTSSYLRLLAEQLRETLLGRVSPREALDRTALSWQSVTEERGAASQLEQFRLSLGLEPIPSP